MALRAIDGALKWAIDDITGKLHVINQDGSDAGEIDFGVGGAGGMIFKGGYNASTNTPDLDSGTPIAITKGDMYVVTVAGDFFTEAVQVGDALIANIDSALVLADWTRLEANNFPVLKEHDITTATDLKNAMQDIIDNPGLQFHKINICNSFTFDFGDIPTGTIKTPFIMQPKFPTTSGRFKISFTNGAGFRHASNFEVVDLDIENTGTNTPTFCYDDTDSGMATFRNCDLSILSGLREIVLKKLDGTVVVNLDNCTGTNLSTATGLFETSQNPASPEFARMQVNVSNNSKFTGIFTVSVDVKEEMIVNVSDSIIIAGSDGTWNDSASPTVTIVNKSGSSNVDETIKPGSTTPTFIQTFKIPVAQIEVADNTGLSDDSGNELIVFQKTASAVNQIDITNAATGNAPSITATGGDTDIDLNLDAKGTGVVKIPGSDLDVTGSTKTETIVVFGIESNVIGGAAVGGVQLELTGVLVKTQALRITSRLQPGAGLNAFIAQLAGTLDIAASGVHPDFAGLLLDPPTITAGSGSVTNATTLKVSAAPTGASNNRAFWVLAGESLFAGTLTATGGGTLTGAWTINGFQTNLVEFAFALSETSGDLVAATDVESFRAPFAFTWTKVIIEVGTAGTGGTLITVDVNINGATGLSTKATIDASEFTSEDAATPAVISTSAIAKDDLISFDRDAIGSTIAGQRLKIWLIGKRA